MPIQPINPDTLYWPDDPNPLLPAIVQHWQDGRVLMLGYMNRQALEATQATGKVTFYSRSKRRLWTKGETSGNVLELRQVHVDCDADTLLLLAAPSGPTCHRGTDTCFGDAAAPALAFLGQLDVLIAQRHDERPRDSYTAQLFAAGTRRIAQKVGEEGVETALAAVAQDVDAMLDESADLMYHLLVLLHARDHRLADAVARLRARHVGLTAPAEGQIRPDFHRPAGLHVD